MNKKLIALAVAGAMSAPLAVQADDVAVSGFADIFYTMTDDAIPTNEDLFSVPEVEVDFAGSGVRVDIDNRGTSGAMRFEQANFTFGLGDSGWALVAGVFNSGLTDDAQDAPDMKFSSNSALFKYYDTLGNGGLTNVAGAAVAGAVGPANITVALVNDPTTVAGDQGTAPVLIISGEVMEGLSVELSQVAADADDLTDINAEYHMGGLMAGVDILSSDLMDAYSFDIGYDLGNGLILRARVENTDNNAGTDIDYTTLYATYALSDNLTVALQTENKDTGTTDTDEATIEFIATF